MSLRFVPEYCFDTFDKASADFLVGIGVRAIILDVDNTLEPYENPKPSEKVLRWLDELRSVGISAAIVSNNNSERIDLFNKELGLVAFSKAGKPLKKRIVQAMAALGVDNTEAVFMGDQVFTDVWGAHNAGIRAILVNPIKDKRDIFTKFKRLLERPVIRKYKKKKQREVKDI